MQKMLYENKDLHKGWSNNWATPQDFFDKLNDEFHFTLDVCADESNHKCSKYFNEDQDGLVQDWGRNTCFMNPPYGREITKWVRKAVESNTTVVCLLPAKTDTRWFHDYIYHKAEIRFVKGRIKFGESKSPAPFGSMVVIFRPKEATEKTTERNDHE